MRCPPGTASASFGADSLSTCVACSVNTYSAAGSTVCLQCPIGTISGVGAASCMNVPTATASQSAQATITSSATAKASSQVTSTASASATASQQTSASATVLAAANAVVDVRLSLGGVDLVLFDQEHNTATLGALAAAFASAAHVPTTTVVVRRVQDVSTLSTPYVLYIDPLYAGDFVRRRARRLAGTGNASIEADVRAQHMSTSVAAALGSTLANTPNTFAAGVAQALQGSPLAAMQVTGAAVVAFPVAGDAAARNPASASASFGASAAAGAAIGAVVLVAVVTGLYMRFRSRAAIVPNTIGQQQQGTARNEVSLDADADEDGLEAAKHVIDLSSSTLSFSPQPSVLLSLRAPVNSSIAAATSLQDPLQQFLPNSFVADALSSAAGGVAAALTAAAPSVPLAGLALSSIAALLSQLQSMHMAEREASALAARLARLQTLVKRATTKIDGNFEGDGTGAAFADEHQGIFRGLVATLRSAERAIVQIGERSRLSAFIASTNDNERITAIDRAISLHVAELSAALSAETLMSIRALHSKLRQTPQPTQEMQEHLQKNQHQQQPLAAKPELDTPLPPFSMNIALTDLAFEPPLDQQMQTAKRGASGVVVFAIWRSSALPVAVKVMNARMATGEAAIPITAWLAEAELMRRLRKYRPRFVVTLFGISATLDTFGNTDRYLVVMERLSGGSLRAVLDGYLAKGRQPPLSQALQWLLETARGVAECHAAGVVHSDVKAANVLLDGARRAKLGDLGSGRVTRGLSASASALAVTATSAGVGRSSVLWLSSELVDDPKQLPSTFSDVFAWAVTAWEVLSCRLPYHGADGQLNVDVLRPRVMMELVSGALRPDLAAVRADAPPAVVSLVQRCWAAEPRDRPEITEVVHALEAATAAFAASRAQAIESEVQAAASDAQSDALRAAAATAAEEDACAAAAELAALRASVSEARAARIAAIQKRHEKEETALRSEAAAAAASLEVEGAAWLAAESASAEAALALRRQRLLDEAAAARALKLRESSAYLDDVDRARIVAEFERERYAVEVRLDEERVRQRAALEARLADRRLAKMHAAEERAAAQQRALKERTDREAEAERVRGDEEVLRAAFE